MNSVQVNTPAGTPVAAEPEPAPVGLGRRLVSVTAIEVVGYGATQVVRLGSSLILTRLLYPAAFGLMAMLSVILFGLNMLSDVGILQAVVRSERGDDPDFLDTAWSIQATRGVGLWVTACLVAWPISLVFREPALLQMLPVGAFAACIQGLTSTRPMTLRRHLRPLPLVGMELVSQLSGILTMVGLALAGLGVWSLVVGSLTTALVQTAISHALPGTHRVRYRIDPDARREVMRFGGWIFASSSMSFVAGRGDQFVVGRYLGAANMGLYNLGLALAEVPESLANRVVSAVLFPLYARIHNEDPAALQREYYRTRLVFDSVVHTALGGLIALAPWLVHHMYDSRYAGAAVMVQILALRTALALWATPCEVALVGMGLSQYGFRRNASVALSTLVAMVVGNSLGGTMGLLWGSTVARLAGIAALWPAARSRGILLLHREALIVPALAAGYGVGSLVAWVLPGR